VTREAGSWSPSTRPAGCGSTISRLQPSEGLRAAVGDEPDPKVVIRGDARLNFREIRQAMLAIDQAGIRGVGLIAKRSGPEVRGD
jgi:biopolymer transport protein ExbD